MNFNRICLILFLLTGTVWCYALIEAQWITREYDAAVASLPDASKWTKDSTRALEKALTRRSANDDLRFHCQTAFMVLFLGWFVGVFARHFYKQHQRAAPERRADASAGQMLEQLENSKDIFIARAQRRFLSAFRGHEIRIDATEKLATFHGFSVVTSFTRSVVYDRFEVPFSELLVVELWPGHRPTLEVRTTKGRITVGDHMQPFQPLFALLNDAVELNRRAPERYREARRREPQIDVPWYGWAILGGALAGAIGAFWWLALR